MMLPVEVPEKDQVTLYHSLLYTTVVYMVCLPCSCHTSDLLWGKIVLKVVKNEYYSYWQEPMDIV